MVALLLASESLLAQAVPPINQCRNRWVLTNVQEMNYGAFVAESGASTITMDAFGGLTTSGLVSLSTSIPVTTWNINVTNTLAPSCATYGFTVSLPRPPAPLRGAGINIPHGNLRLSIPAYGINNATFPQTIAASPTNTAPFTIVIYGEISPTAPQTADEYTRRLAMAFTQSTRTRRARIMV